jgi:serine/threonine protein kinase
LIGKCLKVKVEDRPSLEDILQHPWMLVSDEDGDNDVSDKGSKRDIRHVAGSTISPSSTSNGNVISADDPDLLTAVL